MAVDFYERQARNRVVRTDRTSQSPDRAQQRDVRMACEVDLRQRSEDSLRIANLDLPGERQPAQGARHLDIQEVRGVEILSGNTSQYGLVSGEGVDERRRIDDDQVGPPLSALIPVSCRSVNLPIIRRANRSKTGPL